MIRNRLVATVLLALGTSAIAVLAAEPPPVPVPDSGRVNQPEQPPERIIKIEIGFEPGPLEDPAVSAPSPVQSAEPPAAPTPAPTPVPAVVAPPAPMAPMTAPIGTPEAPKPAPLTLAALERMALGRLRTQTQPPAGHARITLAGYPSDKDGMVADDTDLPHGFVDKVVAAMATAGTQGKPATPEMLAQQYRLINSVRLRYYHLLALQKLVAVREDLAGVSRDAVIAIEAMTAAGQATKAEMLQARVEAREQMAALQNARAVHSAVWHRMAATIGQPELPVGPLAGDIEQSCSVPKLEAAWAHVLDANPDLQVIRADVARRQARLRQSLSGAGVKTANHETTAPDGLIGQATAWFNGSATTREPQIKQQAWTDLSRCEAEVGRLEQSLKQRLADAYARHDRAKEVADLYHTQNLPDAKEAFELSVMGYRQGRGSWPQVQIAQRNYFRMSTEYVEALAELRRAELVILGLLMDGPEEAPPQK